METANEIQLERKHFKEIGLEIVGTKIIQGQKLYLVRKSYDPSSESYENP